MGKIYSLLLFMVLALSACHNEEGSQNIILSDGTPTQIIINPEDDNKASDIKFVAVAPWTAEVREIASSKAENNTTSWIKLSKYSGEAGEVSISITFTPNETGSVRKAEIIIRCGDSEIVITIEQKPSDGTITGGGEEKPEVSTKKIKQIIREKQYYSELISNPDMEFQKVTMNYQYDEQGRLSFFESDEIDVGGKYYYDYNTSGEINVRAQVTGDGGSSEVVNYLIALNDKGLATKLQAIGNDTDNISFSYTDEGRLNKLIYYVYENPSPNDMVFYYDKDGYLTEIKDVTSDESMLFEVPKFYPNKYPNNNMLDMFAFFDLGIGIDFLYPTGCLGRTSDYCLESMVDTKGTSNNIPGFAGQYKESEGYKPGDEVSQFDVMTYDRPEDYSKYEYVYDSENNLKQVISSSVFHKFKNVYVERITEESVIRDGEKYYISNTELKSSEKIGEGVDKDIYTITYIE